MKYRKRFTAALVASMLAGSLAVANAAVTFDAQTGTGFVGKGDVQTALNLNNKQLQDLSGTFAFSVSSVTESTWTCTKVVGLGNGGENEIVQGRSTSTTTQGVLASVERVRNQITGFHLTGYDGPATTVTDGPAVGTCPADQSGFVFDDNVETTTTGGSGILVNGVALG